VTRRKRTKEGGGDLEVLLEALGDVDGVGCVGDVCGREQSAQSVERRTRLLLMLPLLLLLVFVRFVAALVENFLDVSSEGRRVL
jgi:hypothetical protein